MSRFTQSMVKKWVPNWQLTHVQSIRKRYGLLGGWASILVNFLIFIIKLIIGLAACSIALIADAVYTLSDVLNSFVYVISYQLSGKSVVKKYPYGHGRIEVFGSFLVASLIMIAGVEIVRISIGRFPFSSHPLVSWWMIISIGITIGMKELLARFSDSLAKMIDPSALQARDWDDHADTFSTIVVTIAFILQRLGIYWMDNVVGCMLGTFLIIISVKAIKGEIDEMIGKKPSQDMARLIKKTAVSIPDVLDAHDMMIRQYGSSTEISLCIAVPEDLSVRAAHSVSSEVETLLNTKYHSRTMVYIDPVNTKDHEAQQIHAFLQEYIDQNPSVLSFHDVRLESKDDVKYLIFDIAMASDIPKSKQEPIKNQLRTALHDAFPFLTGIIIEVEPKYVL